MRNHLVATSGSPKTSSLQHTEKGVVAVLCYESGGEWRLYVASALAEKCVISHGRSARIREKDLRAAIAEAQANRSRLLRLAVGKEVAHFPVKNVLNKIEDVKNLEKLHQPQVLRRKKRRPLNGR